MSDVDLTDKKHKPSYPVPAIDDVLEDSPLKNPVMPKAPAFVHWMKQKNLELEPSLSALIKMYGTSEDATVDVVIGALSLGFLEDFVCATYFVCFLWLFDTFAKAPFNRLFAYSRVAILAIKGLNFILSWLLFLAMMVPFVADAVIVRLRYMRFTFDLVAMAIEEKDHIEAVAVSSSERTEAYLNVGALLVVATFLRDSLHTYWYLSLTESRTADTDEDDVQDPRSPNEKAELVPMHKVSDIVENNVNSSRHSIVAIDEDCEVVETDTINDADDKLSRVSPSGGFCKTSVHEFFVQVRLSMHTRPLNTTLNELLNHVLEPTMGDSIPAVGDANRFGVESNIDDSEEHTLFGNGTLYRPTKTHQMFSLSRSNRSGFMTPLPSGLRGPSNLFKGSNITITPNFDKWAKRGIGWLAGILNDTIVVISGDHGQGPEFWQQRARRSRRVRYSRGWSDRLVRTSSDAVGMIVDDATEQYDILNTLADITGVPEGGFEQDGVGRSLKRKINNNPSRKMSVVRGHLRLRYDKLTDSMLLHDADKDHDMKKDLVPELTADERSEWIKWRDAGRQVNSYYTRHWEASVCLLQIVERRIAGAHCSPCC
ncbi:Alkaline-phosphatase-like, core domain [Phytophthora cactorum]|nr:Alkaline-phosphatase-like, core domain [Phytophthora cactorum]